MKFGTVDIPFPLLDALRDNKLVVFAGAGVSMGEPACLPDFQSLTAKIAERANKVQDESENLEQFLGRMHDDDVKIHDVATSILSPEGLQPTPLHRNLLRLYRKEKPVRLVTTNFDLLFEQAAREIYDNALEVFHAPAMPLGHQFSGIVHVHGCICHQDQMVLTDGDFGRAYLNEGWARRFLLGLFDTFTILFVGYNHNDTVMNYLVRALPPHREGLHRYALVANSVANHPRWKHLKIETIPYAQYRNDHSQLDDAVGKLATHVERGLVGWQREISAIADRPPNQLSDDDEGIIAHALEDETMTLFFTRSASHPGWIEWLDAREYLDRLFNNGQLRESDKILSGWLANQFLENHSHPIFLLIGRHRTRLHPTFWQQISSKIGRGDDIFPDTTVLSRWITLLLSTLPEKGETTDGDFVNTGAWLTLIARRCIPHQMIEELLSIFGTMIRSLLSIEENYFRTRDEVEVDFQISLDVPLVGEYDELDELWEDGLKPNLSRISKPLLEQVIKCLEDQYFIQHTWGRATRFVEHASQSRAAIEPHDQNVSGHDTDVVIDVARDCLDWLATYESRVAADWCNRLIVSEVPLLRRLAVHNLPKREDLNSEAKLPWLLEHTDLHDYAIHHEIYQAVRHAYPGADANSRKTLIEKVKSYRFPHAEHPDNEEITARKHFNWFHWLHNAYPDCPFAQQAMDEVLAEYPHFESRTHPDFTSWIQPGYVDVGIPSVLMPETLLANRPADLLDELLSLEDDE